jgi:hypothetical protein
MDCNTDYKLAAAARHIHVESDTAWMQDLLDALGVDISLIKGPNFFIAGTMFLIDYDFLINFFSKIEIDVLYNLMVDGYFKEHEKISLYRRAIYSSVRQQTNGTEKANSIILPQYTQRRCSR